MNAIARHPTPAEQEAAFARISAEIALVLPAADEVREAAVKPGGLDYAQTATEEAFHRAMSGPKDFGPEPKRHRPGWVSITATLRHEWHELRQKLTRVTGGPNEVIVKRAQLYAAYRARWLAIADLPDADRRLLRNREDVAHFVAATQPPTPAKPAVGFSAAGFLAELAARGARVARDGDAVLVSPAAVIRPADRRVVADHRAEILDALASSARL